MPLGIVLGRDRSLCIVKTETAAYKSDEVDTRAALLTIAQQYQVTVQGSDPLIGSGRLEEALGYNFRMFSRLPGSMRYMGVTITGEMGSYQHPGRGYGGSFLSSGNEEQFVITTMTNVSAEQVANHIVTLGHKGLWLAEETVSREGEVQARLSIFSYHDDAEMLKGLSCLEVK